MVEAAGLKLPVTRDYSEGRLRDRIFVYAHGRRTTCEITKDPQGLAARVAERILRGVYRLGTGSRSDAVDHSAARIIEMIAESDFLPAVEADLHDIRTLIVRHEGNRPGKWSRFLCDAYRRFKAVYPANPMTVNEVVERFIAKVEPYQRVGGRSAGTFAKFILMAKSFAATFGEREMWTLLESDVSRWLLMKDTKLESKRGERSQIGALFNFAIDIGALVSIEPVSARAYIPKLLSDTARGKAAPAQAAMEFSTFANLISEMKRVPKCKRWIPFTIVRWVCGLHFIETALIRWEDIDPRKRQVTISQKVAGPQHKKRKVLFTEAEWKWIQPYYEEAKKTGNLTALICMYGRDPGEKLPKSLKGQFSEDTKAIRRTVDFPVYNVALRSAFLTYLADLKVSLQIASYYCGSAPKTLERYYKRPTPPNTTGHDWFGTFPDGSTMSAKAMRQFVQRLVRFAENEIDAERSGQESANKPPVAAMRKLKKRSASGGR